MRRPPWTALAVAVLTAGLTSGLMTLAAPSTAAANRNVHFIVTCKPGQQLADDPIVHPGQPGTAHRHQFFGSTATDADSTVRQLEGSATTCDQSADTAAYWMPVVYRNGRAVTQLKLTAYYRNIARTPSQLRNYPEGLKMLAGDSMAKGPQSLTVAEWSCRQPSGAKTTWFSVPPVCTTGRTLVMKVIFPDCWDGRHLDSADHRSHVGYSQPVGVCSGSTPVNIPQLAMTVMLDVPTVTGPPHKDGTAGYSDRAITLASGSAYTLHGDFWNTWNQPALTSLVQRCLIQQRSCPAG